MTATTSRFRWQILSTAKLAYQRCRRYKPRVGSGQKPGKEGLGEMNMQANSVLGMVLVECPTCGGTGEAPLLPWTTKNVFVQRFVKRVDQYVRAACATCAGSGTTMARHVSMSATYPRRESRRRRYVIGAPVVSEGGE